MMDRGCHRYSKPHGRKKVPRLISPVSQYQRTANREESFQNIECQTALRDVLEALSMTQAESDQIAEQFGPAFHKVNWG
jgi:hypothetical protein